MCARAEENNLAFYVKMSTERFVNGVKIIKIIDCEEPKEKNVFKREIQMNILPDGLGKNVWTVCS